MCPTGGRTVPAGWELPLPTHLRCQSPLGRVRREQATDLAWNKFNRAGHKGFALALPYKLPSPGTAHGSLLPSALQGQRVELKTSEEWV